MKQYGTERTNFHAGFIWDGVVRHEAMVGSSYDRMVRQNRRHLSESAVAWWRKQTASESGIGMPQLYHCGGYGK